MEESRITVAARRIAGLVATGMLAAFLLVIYAILAVWVLYGVLYWLGGPVYFIALWGLILGPVLIVAGAMWFRNKGRG